jgi:hypothetical protein
MSVKTQLFNKRGVVMLPLKGQETKLCRDVPGVGQKDDVFFYVRHQGNYVVLTQIPNGNYEVMVSKNDVRWEPGDNEEDDW